MLGNFIMVDSNPGTHLGPPAPAWGFLDLPVVATFGDAG